MKNTKIKKSIQPKSVNQLPTVTKEHLISLFRKKINSESKNSELSLDRSGKPSVCNILFNNEILQISGLNENFVISPAGNYIKFNHSISFSTSHNEACTLYEEFIQEKLRRDNALIFQEVGI